MDLNISLAPEILFYIGSFPITNTLFWCVFVSLILIIGILVLKRKLNDIPGTFQNIVELLVESGYGFVLSVMNNKKKTDKVFPLVFSLFVFVLSVNLFPYLIPGQSAWTVERGDDSIPLFRSAMSDYGMVLLLTLLVVIITQIASITAFGPLNYGRRFINLEGIKKFIQLLSQGKFSPAKLLLGLLDFMLGLMDVLSEFMKIVSMSFRLFGNIFVGEVLMIVMLAIMPFLLPLPFMFLGLLSAVVQAFVFAMLTLISIKMATELEEDA